MKRNKKICKKCNKQISLSNFDRHINKCSLKNRLIGVEVYKNKFSEYECPYCNKIFNKFGIIPHINVSHYKKGGNKKGYIPWNKGLTKNDDIRIKNAGIKLSDNIKNGKIIPWQKGKNKDNNISLKKISDNTSKTVRLKIKNDDWHLSFSKLRIHEYKGIKLHGKWELNYAKWLDKNNIKWYRPKEKFIYFFENKDHYYIPDFYLIDSKEYIEIKGYKTPKDDAKWSYFPKNLILKQLFREDLIKLKII